jgi:hypothetical protein
MSAGQTGQLDRGPAGREYELAFMSLDPLGMSRFKSLAQLGMSRFNRWRSFQPIYFQDSRMGPRGGADETNKSSKRITDLAILSSHNR